MDNGERLEWDSLGEWTYEEVWAKYVTLPDVTESII